MKICVISDTHGQTTSLKAWINENEANIDAFWFLGDYAKDLFVLKRATSREIVAVRGNCDMNSNLPEELILEMFGKKIMLTHGHKYSVKNQLNSLFYKAKTESIDLVCFGHTHCAFNEETEGVILFNPGSPTSPRGPFKRSVGIVNVNQDIISCEHIWL